MLSSNATPAEASLYPSAAPSSHPGSSLVVATAYGGSSRISESLKPWTLSVNGNTRLSSTSSLMAIFTTNSPNARYDDPGVLIWMQADHFGVIGDVYVVLESVRKVVPEVEKVDFLVESNGDGTENRESADIGRGGQMKIKFQFLNISNRAPREGALFWAADESLRSVSYYFSPVAVELVRHLVVTLNRAVPCQAPTRGSVHLLSGMMISKTLSYYQIRIMIKDDGVIAKSLDMAVAVDFVFPTLQNHLEKQLPLIALRPRMCEDSLRVWETEGSGAAHLLAGAFLLGARRIIAALWKLKLILSTILFSGFGKSSKKEKMNSLPTKSFSRS